MDEKGCTINKIGGICGKIKYQVGLGGFLGYDICRFWSCIVYQRPRRIASLRSMK
jgi:hypothetical protein